MKKDFEKLQHARVSGHDGITCPFLTISNKKTGWNTQRTNRMTHTHKTLMIISMQKTFGKMQYPFMIKNTQETMNRRKLPLRQQKLKYIIFPLYVYFNI